jgi:hypothetical protein
MNDPRRRQTNAHTGYSVGLLGIIALLGGSAASCGGHGGGGASEGAQPQAEPTDRATERANARTGAPVQVRNDDDDLVVAPPSSRVPAAYLCTRDPVAFDLSQLTPVDPTATGFASAWAYARAESDIPGFVVTYSGTYSGPVIHASVGPVYPVADNIYSFMHVLPRGEPVEVRRDAADPFRMISSSRQEFITAFGTVHDRQGFVVSAVTVDGRLDARCQSLRDVRVTMTLPKTNIGQRFGGTTMDEALGPMTEDTNGDGEPDSWSVTLAAHSLHNLMFRL